MAGRTKVQFTTDYSYDFITSETKLETRLGNGEVVDVINIPEKRSTITYRKGQVIYMTKKNAIEFVMHHSDVCRIV